MHVAKGDDRYVIACGEEYTCGVWCTGDVAIGTSNWSKRADWEVCTSGNTDVGRRQRGRRSGRRMEGAHRRILNGALVLEGTHDKPAPNVALLAPLSLRVGSAIAHVVT